MEVTPAARARGTPGPALRLERFEGLLAARSEWAALAEHSRNIFATWEWADAWWRHFGDSLRLAAALLRDDEGRAAAVLPLCVRGRRPLRIARFVGYGPADEQGPVCPPQSMPTASEVLLRERAQLDWDVLLAERLPPGHGLHGRVLRREPSPVIERPNGGWEEYLAGRSRNLRSQLGRKQRRLEREHGLRFRLVEDLGRLGADMETLFRLHRARWGDEGSGALGAARAEFHRDFAARALDRGWLRLWLAEADGEPVAAWYGFRFGGAECYYQSGRDPDWERSSVGLVLLAHTMREAMNDGIREYRLLRGGEGYKDRFATHDPGVETVAMGRGLGRAAALVGAGAARLPGRLRRYIIR
jgi:CelD/BcsL family acetyltransferase involved in cellulose biosynthesis